jgi:hypothetical protein
MFDWLKKREARIAPSTRLLSEATVDDDGVARRHGCAMSGQYRSLYQYLEHRYANTVVLTFGQIEDLLGFTLPDRARTEQAWWTPADTGATGPHYFHAWTLTRRTA